MNTGRLTHCRRLIRDIFIYILPLLVSCQKHGEEKTAPLARDGTIDLSGWDFDRDGPVKLDGKWRMAWNKFIDPADSEGVAAEFDRAGYHKVPGDWTVEGDISEKPRMFGFGTAILKIRGLKKSEDILGLHISDVSSAYRAAIVPVGGVSEYRWFIGNGRVGYNRDTAIPAGSPMIRPFKISRDSEHFLILQMSNFDARGGGIWYSMWMGSHEQTSSQYNVNAQSNMAIIAMIFIIGIYNLVIFLQRKEDMGSFWLGIFCMVIALRTLATTGLLTLMFDPGQRWVFEFK
ncbi:MAG: hypothetical protein HQK54_14135, partial [Oligoflexales bacterium]|nr:hypothetical protein [Oligoflexales bacterium]